MLPNPGLGVVKICTVMGMDEPVSGAKFSEYGCRPLKFTEWHQFMMFFAPTNDFA
jgi:hypothetical protein